MALSLQCGCGLVRGEATIVAAEANRVRCYCDDCQTFARHLGKHELLDGYGGSDIVQMTPADVRITQGAEHLRGLRLSPKGTFRWYASCCNTPFANSLSAGWAFLGLYAAMIEDFDGPEPAKINGRFSDGAPDAHPKASVGSILRVMLRLGTSRLRGRHRPSPVFPKGEPISEPQILSREERRSAYPDHLPNPY
ncbi:MAG: DUF6151 family protein [Myxococcota bacterium]